MKFFAIALLFSTSILCYSQSQWEKNRMPYPFDIREENYAMSYLYYGIHYDYKYDEEGRFICDITYHVISRPINDDGLESTNRIYIPLKNVIDVLDIKSRTISKDGSVIELDQNNVKEIEDEENKGGYRIFAVEGAETRGEIEYMYTKRVYGSTFINEFVQFAFPVNQLEFTLNSPENLEFEFYIANDTSKVIQMDTTDNGNKYHVLMDNVPPFESEAFSGGDANKKRLDFRLAYNSAAGKKRLNTYSDAGKRIYDNAHTLTKQESKAISDFIADNDIRSETPIERLKHLEHELKKKYYMDEDLSEDVAYLFSNGFASRLAFLKIFVMMVEYLQLDYEIVVTSNRFETKFETDFSSWNYLDDYLLYFPQENQYLSVHDYTERYGSVPSRNSSTFGIFIHPEEITDFVYPVTRTGFIPTSSYDENMNNLKVNISLNEEISKAIVEAKRSYLGNEANYYKAAFFWMDKEQSDKMLDNLAEYLAGGGKVLNVEALEKNNTATDWKKPFIVSCSYENENFIEYAGSSILFKVGQLIGAQSELYKDEERKFEVENVNNRGYERDITFIIPEGYEVQNLEDLIINEKVYKDDRAVYVFDSSYQLEKNILKIRIDEFYDEIFFPKEKFEEFRKVINAAADWNKVSLVLKEK